MEIASLYKLYKKNYLVATDTRKIEKNAIFIALKGENFDANTFAEEALKKGASYVVVDNKEYYKENNNQYILVANSLVTLQEIAQYHRKQLGIPIIALTGSNGKTTTKELLHNVLATQYSTTATIGNLNNHIGVPLTLLSMTPKTEIGIVEMGANHFDEIAFLCQIATPNYGYITNFGKAHLEGFGSLEGVVKAKSELYQYLAKNKGIAFINKHDTKQLQLTQTQQNHIVTTNKKLISSIPFVEIDFANNHIKSQLIGAYNFDNIVAAIGIGEYFNISKENITKAIASYSPNNKRSQLIQIGSTHVILDAYNANPTSMLAAITNFKQHTATKKIVVLGDMFELGKTAEKEHQYIADLVSNAFEKVILIGENFNETTTANIEKYKNYHAFEEKFDTHAFSNTTILIKGSRGMALERVLGLLKDNK